MKQEQFFLASDKVRANIVNRLMEFPCDGTVKVVFSNAGKKSAKMRGLEWRWYTDVAIAGVGGKHSDTKDGVHLLSKYRWALPILIRDDEFFSEIYAAWKQKHGSDEERMKWFIESQVHTERFNTSQMAEYLTEFQRHYGQMVNLTDPKDMGL